MNKKNQKYLFFIFFSAIFIITSLILQNNSLENQLARTIDTNQRTDIVNNQYPYYYDNYRYQNQYYQDNNFSDTSFIKENMEIDNSKNQVFPDVKITQNLSKLNPLNDTEQVKYLQKFLIAQRFLEEGDDDGIFGTKTQQAVIKLQNVLGITPAVGFVGPKTREIINQDINDVLSTYGLKPRIPPGAKCDCRALSGYPGWRYPGGTCKADDACVGSPDLP